MQPSASPGSLTDRKASMSSCWWCSAFRWRALADRTTRAGPLPLRLVSMTARSEETPVASMTCLAYATSFSVLW
jgi:hypothetical protein